MLKKNPQLLAIIAAVCAVPYVFAEYRRIQLGLFDALYWILAALLLVSVWCIYQLLIPTFMKNYEQMSEEERQKKNMEPINVKCNCAAVVLFIIAAFAFIVSGIISLL